MESRFKELLAKSLFLYCQEINLDYNSEEFYDILQNDLGCDDYEIDEIISTLKELY